MAIQLSEPDDGKVLEVTISGKLTKADYEAFTPEVERLIAAYGKLRMLVEMRDFHGWELSAVWEDLKFDVHHYADIQKLALLGESKWEKGMAAFCKPFTKAEIRSFPTSEKAEAEAWLRGQADARSRS